MTDLPSDASRLAAVNPATPAPMITTSASAELAWARADNPIAATAAAPKSALRVTIATSSPKCEYILAFAKASQVSYFD
jgi:hypothetical protein